MTFEQICRRLVHDVDVAYPTGDDATALKEWKWPNLYKTYELAKKAVAEADAIKARAAAKEKPLPGQGSLLELSGDFAASYDRRP